jgi:enoyl-CoA hydratase
VIIAGESARFDSAFLRIGLHPGGGHTWMLERIAGPQTAAAIALFGESVDAHKAVEIGLAWRSVPDGALMEEALTLASRVTELPRDLARAIKASLREMPWQTDFESAVQTELARQKRSFG